MIETVEMAVIRFIISDLQSMYRKELKHCKTCDTIINKFKKENFQREWKFGSIPLRTL